ncbi:MAG: TonB-dependent receptor [Acidobacteriota bacterium]|nr:TonB-dependent receptor [Acidobacteriota bacterium]
MKSRLLVSLLLLCFTVPAVAIELDGAISGTVRDSSGGALPGVTVTVTSPVLQGSKTAVSKTDGSFQVTKLPPGQPYSVAFTLSGFRTLEITGLQVSVGKDTSANARLDLSPVTADVTVTSARPTVDVTQTNTQQNFSADYLRKIPVGGAGRDYLNIIAQAPGVVNTGNPNVFGGNVLENSWMIDGVNTTDPVTHTFTFNLNPDTIQDVAIQTSNYLAEYGRASGGVVQVITKSGGNNFSGSADIRYSTNDFSVKGQHFDPTLSKTRNTPWDVTLGGPIFRDKLWFFGNVQRPDSFVTPSVPNSVVAAQLPNGQPVARSFKGWNSGGKLSFTANSQISGFAELQDSLAVIGGSQNSALYRPEAQSTQRQRSRLYELVTDGVITSNWSAEIQALRFEDHLETAPTVSDLATTQWVNISGGNVRYDAYSNFQSSERNRNALSLSTSYFVEGAGSHTLKFGADADKTFFPSVNFTTGTPTSPSLCPTGLVCGAQILFRGFDASGNRLLVNSAGQVAQQTVVERQAGVERQGKSYAAYLQDQWRLFSRLTLNLGARYDRSEYFNNIKQNPVNFDKVQPRVGFAYDIMGDGKNVIRGSYGQFYVDAALTFTRLFDTGINSGISRVYLWSPSTSTWRLAQQTGGQFITQALIDGRLKATYDDQISGAFERQLFAGASTSVGYIYKKTNNIYEDTCINNSDCPDFWLSNQPGRDVGQKDVLRKNYYGYTFQFQYYTPNRRFITQSNYVYSKSRGSIDSSTGQYAGTDFDFYPENYVNRYGFLDDDARHRVKINFAYQIPVVETNLSVVYNYRTGLPYTVTRATGFGTGNVEFLEPRGSSRGAVRQQVDLQLEKQVRLGPVNLSVIGSVFNLNNSEQPLTYFTSADSPSTVRTPLTYQRPRNYEVGFRAEF